MKQMKVILSIYISFFLVTSLDLRAQSNQQTSNKPQAVKEKMTKSVRADLSKGLLTIVNKKHYLDKTYSPGVNKEADRQVKKLISDMQKLGFDVWSTYTGYRSYEFQKLLYTNYVRDRGQKVADTFSAKPGHSEHQLGLAFDIKSTSKKMLGKQPSDAEAVKWMHANCYKYGFILRYMKGKEHITGYMYEPWHLRYVGDEAEKIYRSGLCLEEYFDVEGGDYIE